MTNELRQLASDAAVLDHNELRQLAQDAAALDHTERAEWYSLSKLEDACYYKKNARFLVACKPDAVIALLNEIDALRAKLAALESQEPVGVVESAITGAGGFHVRLQHGASMPKVGEALYLASGAQPKVEPPITYEALTDLIAKNLSCTFHCGRSWQAWGVGTMTEDDFSDVGESETPGELATEVMKFINGFSAVAQPANAELLAALRFYADKDHFMLSDPDAWETVSGEPQNFWCDEVGTATVEDGSVARAAIAAAEGATCAKQ